ncbi:MAG: exodeoxyribonuclease VII small subunit [Chlamydiales bacterium]|jgi:exodeoxyribonuclease VII small subunit|nr:exodeoxyribonuclease VII small subunit [Chlamydiales bacterium]
MKDHVFENSYLRLEEILEQMNSKKVSLKESVALYEEAVCLINSCNEELKEVEQIVEKLSKNREGGLVIDSEGKPETAPFLHASEHPL